MTTSAHGSADPWGAEAWAPAEDAQAPRGDPLDDHALLAQETPAVPSDEGYDDAPDDWGPSSPAEEAAYAPTSWEQYEPAADEGLTGRALIVIAALAAFGCAVLDLALTSGRMTFFFDLCFVVICLVSAMAVRRRDLFTAGVLPPLLFAAVIAVVSLAAPQAFESGSGVNKVFLSGLAGHAPGLVAGYAVALLAVAARMAGSPGRARRGVTP